MHNPQTQDLLNWYDANSRAFPWRARANRTPNPYHVWLSEMMLQQTTTTAVVPYFERFLALWPTVHDLARASLDEVLHAWQGLGYYARARYLHACAKKLCDEYGGEFPREENQLRTLPGIGPYTAAAIASIAFNKKATPVDGNIIRVMSRLFGIETFYPQSLPEIRRHAGQLTSEMRPGDFAQALMDLGSTVCTSKAPKCQACPWQCACLAFKSGHAGELPRKLAKKPLPVRYAMVFWLVHEDGCVILNRRSEKGLLGGMMEFPSTPWQEQSWTLKNALPYAPIDVTWSLLDPVVSHTFTHFHLELSLLKGISHTKPLGTLWDFPQNFPRYAFPTVMKKVAQAAQTHGFF